MKAGVHSCVIRVALVDDDPLMREAIELELSRSEDIRCAATFGNFEDAELALGHQGCLDIDVLLLDSVLPGIGGAEAVKAAKKRWPRLKTIAFSMHEDFERVVDAFSAGADGYLLKSAPREQIAAGIRRVASGTPAVSSRVADAMVLHFQRRRVLLPDLSPTEKRILKRFDTGGTYKEIAGSMGISINTLKTHAKRILQKSLASSVSEASFLRRMAV